MTDSTAIQPLPPELERTLRLERIFMPHSMVQRLEARRLQGLTETSQSGLRFAHYTSAESALSILQSKRIWMRNTTCMSDYREVRHGFDILQRYFDPEKTKEFGDVLDRCAPGAAMQAIDHFNGWWNANISLNIYVASLSEHLPHEDRYGRLSMWRAFGANPTRVAIIINIPNFTNATQELGLMFSPVAYLPERDVHLQVRRVMENVKAEADFLKTVDHDTVVSYLFSMLFAGVTCLKHEGFHEEREWRAIYCPQINKSPLMDLSIENVGGVPQHVQKIPLDAAVSDKLASLDLTQIVDRVIIGPSPYPWVLYNSFAEVLEKMGVVGARDKVLVSDIPIRT